MQLSIPNQPLTNLHTLTIEEHVPISLLAGKLEFIKQSWEDLENYIYIYNFGDNIGKCSLI
jgi:hypothetical protein